MFLQAIGKETRKVYLYQLDQFVKWSKVKDYDALLTQDEKSIQRNLEDYLIHLKEIHSPNYIPSIIAPVELFFTMNDVNINSKRLHKMFPTKNKKGGYGSYTRQDIQKMLENTNKKRTKALILFFASTGCRAGAIPELRLKHIENFEDCKSVLVYAESKDEYLTFMTPEASKAFEDYLEERQKDNERLTPDSPAFRTDYVLGSAPAKTMIVYTVRSAISQTTKSLNRNKVGSRYTIPTTHGLRKYFNMVMKIRENTNLSLCEKLMGHSVTVSLDNHYLPVTKEQLFAEYKKAIPELTISDKERDNLLIEKQKEKLSELEKKETKIEELEKKMNILQNNHEEETKRVLKEAWRYMTPEIIEKMTTDIMLKLADEAKAEIKKTEK